MKHYNWNEMQQGYFVGDFKPTAYNTSNVEMSIKGITKGTLDAGYYRKKDDQLICVLKGEVYSNGTNYKEGDILLFEKGEMIEIFAKEDAQILIIKMPGTSGDYYKYRWSDFDEFNAFYSSYLEQLKILTQTHIVDVKKTEIKNEEITVVIQGYVDKTTKLLIDSIGRYLPGARILISTWEDCDISDLQYDEVVINKDPGAVPCEIWDGFVRGNNGNRQILSTKNGLARVTTKYTLKLRSDLVLLGDDFKNYFNPNYVRNEKYSLFESKLIIGELYSRKNFVYHRYGKEYSVPKPFHPSDWFAFGYTADVRRLYDNVELIPEKELRYSNLIHNDYIKKYEYKYSWRYTTEQHIFLSAIRHKFGDVSFRDWTDWNNDNIKLSESFMKDNFIFLDFCRSNILNRNYITACFANNDFAHPEKMLYTFRDAVVD